MVTESSSKHQERCRMVNPVRKRMRIEKYPIVRPVLELTLNSLPLNPTEEKLAGEKKPPVNEIRPISLPNHSARVRESAADFPSRSCADIDRNLAIRDTVSGARVCPRRIPCH